MPPPHLPAPDFSRETALGEWICGIDEVGRGPLAGPVVAAAVIFFDGRRIPAGINDSKRLAPAEREILCAEIRAVAAVGIGRADVTEIDRINILQASLLAMRRAVDALPKTPRHALVDGNRAPALPCAATTVVGGDGLSLSIAAASIVAKVTRDAMMRTLAADHPGYGWDRNVGYGTPEHLAAIGTLGITNHHRLSFAPIREVASMAFDKPTDQF